MMMMMMMMMMIGADLFAVPNRVTGRRHDAASTRVCACGHVLPVMKLIKALLCCPSPWTAPTHKSGCRFVQLDGLDSSVPTRSFGTLPSSSSSSSSSLLLLLLLLLLLRLLRRSNVRGCPQHVAHYRQHENSEPATEPTECAMRAAFLVCTRLL